MAAKTKAPAKRDRTRRSVKAAAVPADLKTQDEEVDFLLAAKAERLLALKKETSAKFQEIDALQQELVDQLGVGRAIELANGSVFSIFDPFVDAAGNPCKLWRHTPINRYDVKVTTGRIG